ncbi:hypothetical protein CUMW_233610 [Citrus unshiu]|uniref:GS catalytic domain-containing protein n=1 Tax=Citrus unshiu TaxID=55188 RepID=A0A2H5QII5_CITUN|nr:hypothetical protein CUMW_233610 [Citrus unshiu]
MISSIKELLELAPTKKVMFSTDAYASPETYFLGAKRAREVVFSVLRDTCIDGDLSVGEAIEVAKDIFALNAAQFYKINFGVKDFASKDDMHQIYLKKSDASESDVSLIRVIWVDASGQHRCRVVPVKRFNDIVTKYGVGLTFACMGMTSAVDGPADGTNLSGTGEIRLMPDLSTRWRIPWQKQEEMIMADMHLKPGEPWEYCPREALRKVSRLLKEEFNLVLNAGFEIEFYLLKSVLREGKEEWVPIDFTPYCSTAAYDAVSPVFQEVLADLHSLNISVEQLHAEAGKGQFEIALGHTVATKAADNLIFTREVVRAVARKHGLLATFVPKFALDDIGSGSHVHISLWQNGENVFMASDSSSKHGMSSVGEKFMAGVLHHLSSILAFTAPVPNSYDRIQPNTWSGAYQCWGKENREAPLRTACPPGVKDGVVSNFELKSFDGCANPHLGLAAIIASGIDGLRRLCLPEPIGSVSLIAKLCDSNNRSSMLEHKRTASLYRIALALWYPIGLPQRYLYWYLVRIELLAHVVLDANPASLDGKLQRLPTSLSESVQALEKDDILQDMIGEKLLIAIKGIRKAEINYYSLNKDAYKQLIHRY